MIKCKQKYENLDEHLTKLGDVLKQGIQKDVLSIMELNKDSEKFQYVNNNVRNIEKAKYVIFSSFMCKDYHESEQFVFIDEVGNIVCTITGRETDLYDMISNCEHIFNQKS